MLIVPDTPEERLSKAQEHAQSEPSSHSTDVPPAYEDIASASSNPISTIPKAGNFVYVHRTNHPIRETYTIDTNLKVPEAFLPALQSGDTHRDNLSLTTSNGSINTTVHILENRPRASLHMHTTNGSLEVRLHGGSAFTLNAKTNNGAIKVFIPRDFQGPLSLVNGNGTSKLSDEVAARTTSFSDVRQEKKCFVGDLSTWKEKDWQGDEIRLESRNGAIKVFYIDEVQPAGTSFWSRLFQ